MIYSVHKVIPSHLTPLSMELHITVALLSDLFCCPLPLAMRMDDDGKGASQVLLWFQVSFSVCAYPFPKHLPLVKTYPPSTEARPSWWALACR